MDSKTLPENTPRPPPVVNYSLNVDTTRAFRSVKEAVEIFGERFLTGEIFLPSPKPPFTLPKQETPSWKSTRSSETSWKSCSPPREIEEPPSLLVNSLKKLESELEEAKKELKLLKEKESETEAALKSLNAQLHKNMSKTTQSEAADEAAGRSSSVVSGGGAGRKMADMKAVKKKKPIVPLLGDLFSKRKRKPNADFLLNPLYTSSQMHWI
ncbi:hypothetical protein R6Q59_033286 [Mikania micrantha]|uniref:WEB family protein n=1 Tax=Mikania micrantha TaxID=192012 RepID=A0A5N6NVY0_9ASTR|nr:hypothetical protein E3N88_17914 [Mikania micrantha]